MRLTTNQVQVLRFIDCGQPFAGVNIANRNAYIGRCNTIESLRWHGVVRRTRRGQVRLSAEGHRILTAELQRRTVP